MKKLKDLTGMKIGKLTVLRYDTKIGKRHSWIVSCECGNVRPMKTDSLKGRTISCGCFARQQTINRSSTHNATKSIEYSSWKAMKDRCSSKDNYINRGITVCDEWLNSFETFFADMGERPSKEYSLDRIDNDKGYCKENCRWATKKEQNNNRRNNRLININGETLTVAQWAVKTNVTENAFYARIRYGWDEITAITKPLKSKVCLAVLSK